MDACTFRIFFFVTLLFNLVGCASLPSQNFTFSLTGGDDKSSSWSQNQLASSAEIIFTFQLRESISNATDAKFSFFGSNMQDPEVSIRMNDEKCSGAYEVVVNYKSGPREFRGSYFKTKPTWDEESKIKIRWENERMAVTLNDKETINLKYSDLIRRIEVEASKGGMDTKEVVYKNLK